MFSRIAAASASLALLVTPPSARAQASTPPAVAVETERASSWSTSFTAERLSSHLSADGLAYLVVGAGPRDSGSLEAAQALESGLRATGRTSLVMGAASLGDVSALDDSALVKRCSALPVKQVAVVRVFPGGEGQPRTAVVTLYDLRGEVVRAFSAQAGVLLEAAHVTQSSPAGEGVSSRAADAVAEVARELPSVADAQAEYEQKVVLLEDYALVNLQNGMPVAQGAVAYLGKHKKPLEGSAFYAAVDRDDLKKQFDDKNALRIGVAVGGGVLAVGSGVVGALLSLNAPQTAERDCSVRLPYDEFGSCLDDNWRISQENDRAIMRPLLFGLGGAILGVVTTVIGLSLDPHPVPLHERRRLADEHNHALRERLGLPEPRAERPELEPVLRDVRLSVGATPQGGAMVLSGRF